MEKASAVSSDVLQKFYTGASIVWGSILGGPLAGCYFLSRNFKALGDEVGAKKALWTGVASICAMAVLVGIVPSAIQEKLPSNGIVIVYVCAIYYFYQRVQQKVIKDKIANGALKQSVWKAVGIALLFLIPSLALVLLVAFPLNVLFGS